jgi:excisionase family DNA binding protein
MSWAKALSTSKEIHAWPHLEATDRDLMDQLATDVAERLRLTLERGTRRASAETAGRTVPMEPADPIGGTPLLLGCAAAARQLGISERTLRGLVYAGRLPAVKIGARRLIAWSDLESFVEALRVAAQ